MDVLSVAADNVAGKCGELVFDGALKLASREFVDSVDFRGGGCIQGPVELNNGFVSG